MKLIQTSIKVPEDLKTAIEEMAKRDFRSFNAQVNFLLARSVSLLDTAEVETAEREAQEVQG